MGNKRVTMDDIKQQWRHLAQCDVMAGSKNHEEQFFSVFLQCEKALFNLRKNPSFY